MEKIRSIDGLRGVSIILVLLAHAGPTIPYSFINSIFYSYVANAHLGVRIFFVISGYLITKLLLKEKDESGEINLKNFYIKRSFRIFPVFYTYLITVIIIKLFVNPELFKEFLTPFFAGTYLWNYKQLIYTGLADRNGGWIFGHFWTLAMEEQFYLIWPILFKNINMDRLLKLVIILILIMPFLRVITYYIMPNSRGQIAMMLHTGGDTILMGCLGALIERKKIFLIKKGLLHNKLLIIAVLVFLLFLSPYLSHHFKGAYDLSLGISLNNIAILFIIFCCTHSTKNISLLTNKIIVQIGIISYSLYIWQQLFLTRINVGWENYFPFNIVITFLVAFISFYYLEKPVLKLREKYLK